MKYSFLGKPFPVVTGIMGGQTPAELIAEARNSEFGGAHGIAISLSDFKPEFRNVESLKSVIDSVPLPFMFFFYRDDKWQNLDDDARQEVLLSAADAGASMIDVMGDLYDPSPMELTLDQAAIDKQKRLIERIHEKGAEVVISSHMSCARTTEQVLEHLRHVEERDPDVVKIVTTADTEEEFAEAIRTTMTLKRELRKPFIHLCSGKFGRPQRFIGPTLGVAITFAVPRFEPRYGYTQPTIKAMRAVIDNMHWNISDSL